MYEQSEQMAEVASRSQVSAHLQGEGGGVERARARRLMEDARAHNAGQTVSGETVSDAPGGFRAVGGR